MEQSESSDLFDVLEKSAQTDLNQRDSENATDTLFIEHIEQRSDGSFETDFTFRQRSNGPGLSKKGHETKGFDLEEDEGFGYQTGAIWHPAGYAVLQYNHSGPKARDVEGYFSLRESCFISLTPMLDVGSIREFRRAVEHLGIECRVNVGKMRNKNLQYGMTLNSAIQLSTRSNAQKVTLTLSYGKGKKGGPISVVDEVDELLESVDDGIVERLRIRIRPEEHLASDWIDLLEHRVSRYVENKQLIVDHSSRMLDRERRFAEMRKAYAKWNQQLKL